MSEIESHRSKSFIYYNPVREDYSITEDELNRLLEGGQNVWKDFTIASSSIAISCLLNAIVDTPNPFILTLALFLNYLVGILGLILAIVFGIVWYRTRASVKSIVETIKSKPKMPLSIAGSGNIEIDNNIENPPN